MPLAEWLCTWLKPRQERFDSSGAHYVADLSPGGLAGFIRQLDGFNSHIRYLENLEDSIMEWKTRVYEDGDTRQRTAFLLFPKQIFSDGYRQWKWLTVATWIDKRSATWGDNYWYAIEWK